MTGFLGCCRGVGESKMNNLTVNLIFGNKEKQGTIKVSPCQFLTFLKHDLKYWVTETVWKNEEEWTKNNIDHMKQKFLDALKIAKYEPNFEWLGFETEIVEFKALTKFIFTTQKTLAHTIVNFEYVNKAAHDKIDNAINTLIDVKYQTKVNCDNEKSS